MRKQSTHVSSKGQTVVPAAIRKQFGIEAGTVLDWDIRDNEIIIRPVTSRDQDTSLAAFKEWGTDADDKAYANL